MQRNTGLNGKQMATAVIQAVAFLAWLGAAGCAPREENADTPAVREWPAMGTRVRLTVRGSDAESRADAMAAAARSALEVVEAETSAFRAGNEVARTADAAGSGEWVPVGTDFEEALGMALDVAEATDGAFNPLVGPLMERYGFARHPEGTPTAAPATGDEIPAAWLDWRQIELRPGACRLPVAGMRLDFGGVAKGVGADRAASAARTAAEGDFLLDVGGTLLGRGTWTIGLRDPRRGSEAEPLRSFALADGMACATSGNYERHVEDTDGHRTGHLMDPRTGRPADNVTAGNRTVLQTTAFARTATEADAWSTALYVLGPEAGRAALAHDNGHAPIPVAAAWVLADEGTADGITIVLHPTGPTDHRAGEETD